MSKVIEIDSRKCVVEIPEPADNDLVLLNSPEDEEADLVNPSTKKVRFQSTISARKTKTQKSKYNKSSGQCLHEKKSRVIPEPPRVPPLESYTEPDSFEVEAILGHRMRFDTGTPEFLLKWKGYPSSENSWEPPANLDGCKEMLHVYIIEKVLHVSQDPHSAHRSKSFLDLLPAKLKKIASHQTLLVNAKKESIKSESQVIHPCKASKNHKELVNGSITHKKRLSSTPSKPKKHSLALGNKVKPIKKSKKTTVAESVKKVMFTKPSSKVSRKTAKANLIKSITKPEKLAPPLSPEKEDQGQENVQKESSQCIGRNHSIESLKECSLHCNGSVILLPSSPDLSLSPLKPSDSSLRSGRHSSSSSLNDSQQFCLQLSPSPQPHHDGSYKGEHISSPLHAPASQSHLNGMTNSTTPSPQNDHEPLNTSLSTPSSHPPDSSSTRIPRHLLHKHKLFSTPMPLPRTKRKNFLSLAVPTKAAKASSRVHHSKRYKRYTVASCDLPTIKQVLKHNGVSQNHHSRQVTSEIPHKKNGMSVESETTSVALIVDELPRNETVRVGRFPESAATLLYKELLLNWQHQLNKQRDGTDEFMIVENCVDRVLPPLDFTYISSNRYTPGVPDPSSPEVSSSLCGCECYSLGKKCGTKSASFCCPKMANADFAYSKAGKVQVEPGTPIYECNSKCSCPPDCGNKVVQHGRKIPLCIFRTNDGRGWGVKTLQPIKAHSFVTEYVGEVITSEEAEKRGKLYDQRGATYLFDLDFDDDNSEFTIDAAREGNVSHFFNHSCQPNLVVYSVWIESLDKRLPRIAFFTTRNISAGEELVFDYQMNHDQSISTPSRHKKMRMRCLCGSEKCLGYYW